LEDAPVQIVHPYLSGKGRTAADVPLDFENIAGEVWLRDACLREFAGGKSQCQSLDTLHEVWKLKALSMCNMREVARKRGAPSPMGLEILRANIVEEVVYRLGLTQLTCAPLEGPQPRRRYPKQPEGGHLVEEDPACVCSCQ